jgi:hypothetical protein
LDPTRQDAAGRSLAQQQQLRERYQQLDRPQQLGNLASTLARVSSRAPFAQYDALIGDLLREAALFIEWSAPHVPVNLLADLAAMQRELLAWRRIWLLDPARPLLGLYARNSSDRLLRVAGLAPQP